jgi:hypothetical protein
MGFKTQDVVARTKLGLETENVVARNSRYYYKNCFKIRNTRCNCMNRNQKIISNCCWSR